MRQLLNHTSGLIDTNDITQHPTLYLGKIKDPALRAKIATTQRRAAKDPGYEFSPQLWVELAAALPLMLPPRSAYHYSNIGYMIAGLVAERAGKQRLPTLFRTQIVAPLDLTSVSLRPALEDHRRPRTRLPGRRKRQAHRHNDVDLRPRRQRRHRLVRG